MNEITINFKAFGLNELNNFIFVFFGACIDLKGNFGIELNILRCYIAIWIVDHSA